MKRRKKKKPGIRGHHVDQFIIDEPVRTTCAVEGCPREALTRVGICYLHWIPLPYQARAPVWAQEPGSPEWARAVKDLARTIGGPI